MQYSNYDYDARADEAPWTSAPGMTDGDSFNSQMMPLTANPVTAGPAATGAEALALGSVLQTMQQTQLQQMYVLRSMDVRLTRLEQTAQYARAAQAQAAHSSESFERTTWWALWGLLMLVLGGALAIITVLIMLNVQIL